MNINQSNILPVTFRMQFLWALFFLTVSALTLADELENCKCWSGYEPASTPEGVLCQGIYLLHTMECNIPQPPRCICNSDATGILTDKTGIWCAQYFRGKEIRRWHCENKEDWDKYYHKSSVSSA